MSNTIVYWPSVITFFSEKQFSEEEYRVRGEELNSLSADFDFVNEDVAREVYDLDDQSASNLAFNTDMVLLECEDDLEKNIIDFLHLVKLNYIQRDYFLRQTNEYKQQLADLSAVVSKVEKQIDQVNSLYDDTRSESDKLKNKLDETNDKSKRILDTIDTIEDTKSGIYTDFIAILGIFTAISFVTFGATDMLASVFTQLKHVKFETIGYSFIVGGIYFLSLYGLVVVMFSGIYKIINRKRRTTRIKEKNFYPFTWYIVVASLIVILVLFGVGFAIVYHLLPIPPK